MNNLPVAWSLGQTFLPRRSLAPEGKGYRGSRPSFGWRLGPDPKKNPLRKTLNLIHSQVLS